MTWERNGYTLRPARREEGDAYFRAGFDPMDPEVVRLTGSQKNFTREEVLGFFLACFDDPDRRDFLLLDPAGKIIGESTINEIDWELRSANFRIGIFRPAARGKGIGSWMVEVTRDFAFEALKLHRLELDVFSFNPRARRVYEKAGFKVEGVLRDAMKDGDRYADDILMAILEDEWRALKG